MKAQAATFFLVAALIGLPAPVLSGDSLEANRLLQQMSAAMSQMSYQGTFVYVRGEDVETIRITHISDRNGVRERLVSVSGAPREVLRDSTGVRWVLADDESVFQDTAFNRSFFPELPLDLTDQAGQYYSLTLGTDARIAGHQARNLNVLPRDEYRYGYSLWLEKHSGLLLKWKLVDSKGKPLAKLMFTDVRFGSEVDARELKPSSRLSQFKTVESQLPSGRGLQKASPRWQPSRLPPGFQLTAHRVFGQQEDGLYEHLVYSDGLAAVSVYVESSQGEINALAGLNKMGTTHAFCRREHDTVITVVGDVPAVTVRFIADAVSPASP